MFDIKKIKVVVVVVEEEEEKKKKKERKILNDIVFSPSNSKAKLFQIYKKRRLRQHCQSTVITKNSSPSNSLHQREIRVRVCLCA